MKYLISIANVIDLINKRIVSVLIFIHISIMCVGEYGVFMRHLAGTPIVWVWEVNAFQLLILTTLGGAYVLQIDAHVRLDVFYSRFSPRTKAFINVILCPLPFIYIGCMTWVGFVASLESLRVREHSPSIFAPPVYPFRFFIPIGFFLLGLQVIAILARNLHTVMAGKELKEKNLEEIGG